MQKMSMSSNQASQLVNNNSYSPQKNSSAKRQRQQPDKLTEII